MKLIVFADSHMDVMTMRHAVERERPDMAIHLGDHLFDAQTLHGSFPETPMHCVRGNCDSDRDGSAQEELLLCGRKIILTHGHRYRVKAGYGEITAMGVSSGADLVMFGHTHRAFIDKSGNMTLFNPGAVGGHDRSYGIVHIDEKGIKCKIRRLS